MSGALTKADLLAWNETGRDAWRQLVAAVGETRMEQPGPMGEWTFKDLAAHLTGWREVLIAWLEAGPGQEPPTPWPAELTADDDVNDWIYARNRDRPLRDVLADADASYTRIAAAIAALPEEDVTTPGRFSWLEGEALVRMADFPGHLAEEHEPSVRAWLAGQGG
jgi:hypothetical protein